MASIQASTLHVTDINDRAVNFITETKPISFLDLQGLTRSISLEDISDPHGHGKYLSDLRNTTSHMGQMEGMPKDVRNTFGQTQSEFHSMTSKDGGNVMKMSGTSLTHGLFI